LEFLQGIFSRVRSWFAGIWEKTERRDRTRFIVISLIAVVLLAASLIVLNNGRYEDLVTPANPSEMNSVTGVLNAHGISHRAPGGTIQVNRNDFSAARAAIIAESTISLETDWSIYALGTGLTATAADRRVYERINLQNELKRTLEALPMINIASVFITTPENRGAIFRDEIIEPTAGVMLWLNSDLSDMQVSNIEMIVASAVPGLTPENVRVTDSLLRPLNRRPDGSLGSTVEDQYEHQKRVERDLSRASSRVLELLYGPRNINVEVNATLDFDDYTSDSITFTPVVGDDEGIPRSMLIVNEHARGSNLPGGFPGTDENGLGMDMDMYPEVLEQMASVWERSSETINYEINQVNETLRRAQGQVTDLTISVIINSDGLEPTDVNTEAVRRLVGASAGLAPAEYATRVVVEYMPMRGVRLEDEALQDILNRQDRNALYELIQTLVLFGVIGLALVLLIWRTFAFLKPQVIEIPSDIIAGDAGEYSDLLEAAASTTELEITKTPTRERIEEFIESNPEAVAHMLRAWLQEEEENRW
jgi:flagellar M-ring protein FliF